MVNIAWQIQLSKLKVQTKMEICVLNKGTSKYSLTLLFEITMELRYPVVVVAAATGFA